MPELEIVKPNIFDLSKIMAGVTTKNLSLFPKFGFSISSTEVMSIEDVINHRKILCENLGFVNSEDQINHVKFQKQVHGDEIKIINKNQISFDYSNQGINDGMITNEKKIFLCISLADCCGILIYDKEKSVISAIHSGWKGTSLNIAKKAIDIFKTQFDSNVSDLCAFLTPAASGERYEVREDVAELFPRSTKKISNEKFLFDNRMEIKLQLLDCGLSEQNIEVSDICTIKDESFHSFRRDKQNSGRMAAFIGML